MLVVEHQDFAVMDQICNFCESRYGRRKCTALLMLC